MGSETPAPAATTHPQGERCDEVLAAFLAGSPGARKAALSLRAGAEVAVRFTDVAGSWRIFRAANGTLCLEARQALDADFELLIPPQALRDVCAAGAHDLADLGIAFFQRLVAREPQLHIHAVVHSGLVKLTRRGWFALLAQGGAPLAAWMGREGVRGPGAIAGALARLRGR